MKFRGGQTIPLSGRPGGEIQRLDEPAELYLPLFSRRFEFGELCVGQGQRVRGGEVLARDGASHGLPLLAPRGGTVRLDLAERHVVLQDLVAAPPEPLEEPCAVADVPQGLGSVGMKRYKTMMLGAWQFVGDAQSGELPNPFGTPQAVIVSTMNLEPFMGRGDAQLRSRQGRFLRGLEQIHSLLDDQPIYVVLPDLTDEFARSLRQAVEQYPFVKTVCVPLRYPFDHFGLLARRLGHARQVVWAMRTEGVLAIERALGESRMCDLRVISIAGPAAIAPAHVAVVPGYPLDALLAGRVADGAVRMVNGGVLTGRQIPAGQRGLDCECSGISLLPEHTEREFLSFARPGARRWSFSRCFLSALRRPGPQPMTNALRGEPRPCVSCGFCEEACPNGIMPHLLHKLLYQDDLEAAQRAGVDLCVDCGLCSFVCPSKIDLAEQFAKARADIRRELDAPEVTS